MTDVTQWVDVLYVQDWDDEPDMPEWQDRDAMAEYMTQWDFGVETDAAHTKDTGPIASYWHSEHIIGGLTYTLATSRLGDAALYRRPL